MEPVVHVETLAPGRIRLSFTLRGTHAFGMGERYDAVERTGLESRFQVMDHFTCQGAETYVPIPFLMTDGGQGAHIVTHACMRIVAEKCAPDPRSVSSDKEMSAPDQLIVMADVDVGEEAGVPSVRFFEGTPARMLSDFVRSTGAPVLPPKWSLGVWMSANRWNTQALVEEQHRKAKAEAYPATVLVVEAWSDESTFHEWNPHWPAAAVRAAEQAGETLPETGPWPDPAGMIKALHEDGIRLVLWQIPVLKALDPGQSDSAHDAECADAREKGFVPVMPDGSPFRIPKGKWFPESMLLDFTHPDARAWWFDKRSHLLAAGVDGFKTDGGEMVYSPEAVFSDGSRGTVMRNRYPLDYIRAYEDFIGSDRVLFSRAGAAGAQMAPMHWAGDQLSTWEEFRSVMRAGLSAGLSGLLFWTFDIAGFTGPLPTADLYLRATQAAAYTACLQWHSDMPSGQYGATASAADRINDRSPWNMAIHAGNPSVQTEAIRQAHWRMNLMPHIWNEARNAVDACLPLMRHPLLDWPEDTACFGLEDQFMLGGLMVAPILEPDAVERTLYLPEGGWLDLFSGESRKGGRRWTVPCVADHLPVYLQHGRALPLNLDASLLFGAPVGNRLDGYDHLAFVLAGDEGIERFRDDLGHDLTVKWAHGAIQVISDADDAGVAGVPDDGGRKQAERLCNCESLISRNLPEQIVFLTVSPMKGEGLVPEGRAGGVPYEVACWRR